MMKKLRMFWFQTLWAAVLCAPVGALTIDSLPDALPARGGLCVVIGAAGDTGLAEALVAAGPWVVHGLDNDARAVVRGREHLQAQGVYGRITVEHWVHDRLPHGDNLVTLILVRDAAQSPGRDALWRALAPEGVLLETGPDGAIEKTLKPRPPEMGDWTHPWHDADGSLSGNDRALSPPNAFQWLAGPSFPMAHRKNSAGVILSSGGRVFLISQNVVENIAPGSANHLVARDAFNGVLLWSRPWEGALSRGHADAVHEAIVATPERVYAVDHEGVMVLAALDGEQLAHWPTPSRPNKLILVDGILIAQCRAGLSAFAAADGEPVWSIELEAPRDLIAADGRAFCLTGTRKKDGQWHHELVAVGLADGRPAWKRSIESIHGHGNTAVLRLHFVGGGALCMIERRHLRFMAADDGRDLWEHESQTEARGSGGMDSRQVGHFFRDGQVWIRHVRATGGREAPETWIAADPLTGAIQRELDAHGPQGVISSANKVSCQPLTATARYVLDARLATIWDFDTGERHGYKFVRGGCQTGLVPANGLAYTDPNACGCLDEQLRALMALTHTTDSGLLDSAPGPLETGPAYDDPALKASSPAINEWPMYRGDMRRSSALAVSLAPRVAPRWETHLSPRGDDRDGDWRLYFGRPWSPPVVAGNRLLLAETQSHQIVALDRASGAETWRFTAGGRITVPPTVHGGLALFGAHDGYVYALRMEDGVLAWRRRAAPSDRRIMAYGQLESAWPVAGGVWMHAGVALAAAGRAVDGDGGFALHAFDPRTGEVHWSRRIDSARYGMCDPLTGDGSHVYLMDRQIDPLTGEVTPLEFGYGRSERGGAALNYPPGIHYLRGGKSGLLEFSWTERAMPLRKAQSTLTWGSAEGEQLAYADGRVYAFQIICERNLLWASPRIREGGGRIEAHCLEKQAPDWAIDLEKPAQVEAMVVVEDVLFLAGPADRFDPHGAGFLKAVARQDGAVLERLTLPAPPVFDGLSAAADGLYVVLRDGQVLMLSHVDES